MSRNFLSATLDWNIIFSKVHKLWYINCLCGYWCLVNNIYSEIKYHFITAFYHQFTLVDCQYYFKNWIASKNWKGIYFKNHTAISMLILPWGLYPFNTKSSNLKSSIEVTSRAIVRVGKGSISLANWTFSGSTWLRYTWLSPMVWMNSLGCNWR